MAQLGFFDLGTEALPRHKRIDPLEGIALEDGIPDATTLWLFREKLAKAGLIEMLFQRFDQHLQVKGYIARGGQMVDATIVQVPKSRNTREENEEIKSGQTPRNGRGSPRKTGRRTRTRAGPRSTAGASTATRTTSTPMPLPS